jgi:hypothetical protein
MELLDKYLIKSNIWVALCFTALVVYFQLNLYQPYYSVWGIAFFGTLGIYNFTRIPNWKNFQNPRYRNQFILTIIGVIGAVICVILRGFELKTFLYLAVLGFVSFCYSLPFKGLGLRAIPFLKLFLIAFVWAGSSIGLLLVVHHSLWQHCAVFASVFFFVIGITIPFDIRDVNIDESELKTIPQILGIKGAKILSIICLILSMGLFYVEFPLITAFTLSWYLTTIISILFCVFSSPKNSPFYYSFWMESCSLLPLILYLIIR